MSRFGRRLQQSSYVSSPSSPPSGDPTANAGAVTLGTTNYTVPVGAIFVATNGNDTSGTGAQASPYATFAKALSVVAASGTIVLRAGSYNEGGDTQAGTGRNPGFSLSDASITIQNYPGEAVWFDGSTTFAGNAWTFDSASGLYWASYNRVFDRSHTFSSGQADGTGQSTGAGGWFIASGADPTPAWPDMILLDGNQLAQVQTQGEVVSGKFYVEGSYTGGPNAMWFTGTKVWIKDNPSGHEMRYANKTSWAQTFADGITIRGIGFRRYATFNPGFGMFYIAKANVTIENCFFEDMSASACWIQDEVGKNCTFRHVTCRRIGYMFASGTDGIIYDSVDLQGCNYGGWNVDGPALAIVKMSGVQGVTIKNSIFSNSNCTGFWTDQTVANPVVYNCRFENLGRHGIDYEGASGGIFANILFNSIGQYGIWNNDSDTAQIWNCTFNDCVTTGGAGAPFTIGQSARRPTVAQYSFMIDPDLPSSYYDEADHQFCCNQFTLRNNVIVQTSASNGTGMFYCQNSQDTSGPTRKFQPDFGPDMDSNVYWWQTQPQYPWVCAQGQGVNPNVYFSLSSFHSATGLETNSTQPAGNPLNASLQVTDSTLHTKATALPSNIATLVGQTTGTKHAGAFLVG